MAELILVRGLPGSGKSSLANLLTRWDESGEFALVISADDYFTQSDGVYAFDPSKLKDAHDWCQRNTRVALIDDRMVVVNNTFSCRWEMQFYLELAKQVGCMIRVIDLFDAGLTDQQLFDRNVHGVPLLTINQMRRRWEHDWKYGDSRPPWARK